MAEKTDEGASSSRGRVLTGRASRELRSKEITKIISRIGSLLTPVPAEFFCNHLNTDPVQLCVC